MLLGKYKKIDWGKPIFMIHRHLKMKMNLMNSKGCYS